MNKLILISLIFIGSISSYGADIKNCTSAHGLLLRRAIKDSHKAYDRVLTSLNETLEVKDRSIPRKTMKKLRKAKYILKCAGMRLESLNFTCNEDMSAFMRVLPIVGNEVEVWSQKLDKSSYDFIVGTILHEATHKCGTNDADYFYQKGKKPASTWYSGWHNIASTYDYWAIHGFCIPGHDC